MVLRDRFEQIKGVRHKCKSTWMHERCDASKELSTMATELYLRKERTQLDSDKAFWHEVCEELHEHIAYAMEEL